MTTLSTAKYIDDVKAVPAIFTELVSDLLDNNNSEGNIKRIAVQIPKQNILHWYVRQKNVYKLFWSDRENSFSIAGIAAADIVQNGQDPQHARLFKELKEKISPTDKSVRYYGGFKFDISSGSSKEWTPFGNSKFTLPRFEMTHNEDTYQFACNLFLPDDYSKKKEILHLLSQLDFTEPPITEYDNTIVDRIDFPDKGDWMEMINRAVRSCTSGRFDKIVLARKTALRFKNLLKPDLVFKQLYTNSSRCFHFCFQEDHHTAFVGATPERLYLRTGSTVKCEAVAGTRRRDPDEKIDRLLGEELMESKKDLKEHSYVVDSINESIAPYTDNGKKISGSETTLLKLARVQHLLKRFQFSMKKEVADFELINALHPTAAVGGYPKENICDEIFDLEQFDRGWYAAPVGWIGKDASEFAVAIRSGLIDNKTLNLYSGAGIIDGSVSESEWDEIENKISNFLKALS